MEKRKKYCVHCCQLFVLKRNPEQQYCHQPVCQNARKYHWRKQKYDNDPDYVDNQQRTNKAWQQRHSDYWCRYRETHPSYAQSNREQQRMRDQRRSQKVCKSDALILAKSDALPATKISLSAVKPGIYRLIPVTHSNLAKSDALTVEITLISTT